MLVTIKSCVAHSHISFFCRYLGTMKSYVRNKARPEGCIAECYLADETMHFMERYFDDSKRFGDPPPCVAPRPEACIEDITSIASPTGTVVGGSKRFRLTEMEALQAHRHVLTNCSQVDPFITWVTLIHNLPANLTNLSRSITFGIVLQ